MFKGYFGGIVSFCLLLCFSTGITAQVVTSTADSGPGSLRDVIASASPGSTITFDASTNGNTITLSSAEIIIDKSLTITGNGQESTTIAGDSDNRIFNISNAMTVSIGNLTMTDGTAGSGGAIFASGTDLSLEDAVFNNGTATGPMGTMGGGAVYITDGDLTVNNSNFNENDATGTSGSGGAILFNGTGNLRVNNSSFSNNSSQRAGGAIEVTASGSNIVSGSSFTGNDAGGNPGNGGGIHLGGPTNMLVVGGTFTNNTAVEGGGIWNGSGTLGVRGGTITNNTATGNDPEQGGGGLYNNGNGTISVRSGTVISGNAATGTSGSGGGILNNTGAELRLNGVTVTSNSANRAGGGIEDASGSGSLFLIQNSNIDGNSIATASPGNGGGIHIGGSGGLTIIGGTVSNNTAVEGGGIWIATGTLDVRGTTIDGNSASGAASDQGGGGLYSDGGGTMILRSGTTVSNNTATGAAGSGGGILNNTDAELRLEGATVTGNSANRAGGGIEDASGSGSLFLITNSNIDNNSIATASPGNGGGIHIGGSGGLTISGGTVNSNTAVEGGGIWIATGTLDVRGTTIDGNTASGAASDQGGGGLYSDGGGTMILRSGTTVSNNTATGAAGSGGGILNNTDATLRLSGVSVTDNSANRAGGGIEDASGSGSLFLITNSNIDNNSIATASPGNGGGIHIGGDGGLIISGGTVNGNTAVEGGGIWIATGTLDVRGTTIDGNSASGAASDQGGGGLYSDGGGMMILRSGTIVSNNTATGAAGSGGGILNNTGASLRLRGVTVSGNTANRAGGGIEDNSGSGTTFNISNSTLTMNVVNTSPGNGGAVHITGAGSMFIVGSTVDNNTAGAEGGGLWNGTGTMRIDNCTIEMNTASGDAADNGGGGVFNNGGTLTIVNNTVIDENSATGASGSGGGIFSTDGNVTVIGSTISNNSANRAGGGTEIIAGAYASRLNTYSGNTAGPSGSAAPGNGGAFHVTGASTISFVGDEVTGNTAANQGGGLWNQSGSTMQVLNTSVTSNTVTNNSSGGSVGGGGIYNSGGTLNILRSTVAMNSSSGSNNAGGGILNNATGTMTVTLSTISSNTVNGGGGGIVNDGTLQVSRSTVAGNTATIGGGIGNGIASGSATTNLSNTIVADNTAGLGPEVFNNTGSFSSNGYNLIESDPSNSFPAMGTDIEGADPNLGPLADNGGSTMTHALMCPSPAVNAGNPAVNSTDQIGQMVMGSQRDIGAFEAQVMSCLTGPGDEDENALILFGNNTPTAEVYPNPASANLHSEVTVNLSEFSGRVVVRLIDPNGRMVGNWTLTDADNFRVPITDLPVGVYSIFLTNDTETLTKRLVVQQ